ncbi:hypothetical protein VNI00_008640 [Paramarasmius palmivorus]|uniref:RNA helicase n=1 Tax=Paramarasmius palmivorus TaxID=297713 RepID=A0AAW0CWL8_9AGAR
MAAPSTLCPNVLAHGTCSTACPFEHNIPSCNICSLTFKTKNDYTAHLNTKEHLNKVQGETGTVLFCSVCEKQQERASPNVRPEEPEQVPGYQFCVVCDQHIPNRYWAKHPGRPKHKERMQYLSFQSAVEEAEKDKNGVSVKGDVDFDIVELLDAAKGCSKEVTLLTTEPTSQVSLVDCHLASTKGRQTYSAFTVVLVGANRKITTSIPLKVQIKMQQTFFGRSQDRLELTFEDEQLNSRFIITRELKVIVGSKSDHKALRPQMPYVPRKRSENRQPETLVIPGEIPPSTKAIPYVGVLPQARIPENLPRTLSTGTVSEIVDRLQKVYIPQHLSGETYGKLFKHVLWAEEFQAERDLEFYDISDAVLTRYEGVYHLDVPGLAEKRPSVLVGDRILVQHNGRIAQGHWFEGCVHALRKSSVVLKFNRSFAGSTRDRYLVRFKLNRIPIRRQHQAMDSAFVEERVLFPGDIHWHNQRQQKPSLYVKNKLIASNPRQLEAVQAIVSLQPGSIPFVVFGPPGTGKTVTVVEAMLQILSNNPDARILACAPSNSAADLIAQRLISLGPDVLFRAYAPSRFKDQVPDNVLPFTYQNAGGHFSVPPMARMKRFRVVVCTCVSANIVSGIGIPRGHYSHIFVDEAGQATEPEVMISIKTMADRKTNIVLSGDPKQLGPIIRSSVARNLGLEVSFLERLMDREMYDEIKGHGKSVVKLTRNYRSHNAILDFPNERFYGGDLEACADPKLANIFLDSNHVISAKFPIVFHAVLGKDDREASSPSFFNADEVIAVKSLVNKLNHSFTPADHDIGIIAPYHAQVLKIRNSLKAFADTVKVGSVEEFQGQERKVIIISTVRSSREFVAYDLRHTFGFVANARRFNVAVTRAQALLLIVGDPSVLSLDPLWRMFLNYIWENGGWNGAPPEWNTDESVDPCGGYDRAMRDMALDDMNSFSRMMETLTLEGLEEGDEVGNVDKPWGDTE